MSVLSLFIWLIVWNCSGFTLPKISKNAFLCRSKCSCKSIKTFSYRQRFSCKAWFLSRKGRKIAKADFKGQQVNESTRQQDLRTLRLCESPLNLTLGIFQLTDNVNTNYRYCQYRLPVLPIPVIGTTNTSYRYYHYQLPVLPVPRSEKKLILLLNFSRLWLVIFSKR